MIPARLGSKRLPKKNLRELGGEPLIVRAIKKAVSSGVFDEVWVSSESEVFANLAKSNGAKFHHRPEWLGSDHATSEDFVYEFLEARQCDYLIQLHSIAPLISREEVVNFTSFFVGSGLDVLYSTRPSTLEVIFRNQPVNFSFDSKTNSQDLTPVQEITWSITGWKRDTFLKAAALGKCATYEGKKGYYPLSAYSAHVIKTEDDLNFAKVMDNFLQLQEING